jgi:glycosyltransferase involved in cell wall biosynthesis
MSHTLGNSQAVPEFSIIICSIDQDKFARVTANYGQLFPAATAEIIGIHDARSLAEGYNRGIAQAQGRYLILSHDDIRIITPDFAARVRTHLETFDLIGVAGTTRVVGPAWSMAGNPHEYMAIISPSLFPAKCGLFLTGTGPLVVPDTQALDGVMLCMRAQVARAVPFDGVTFDGFHLYDIDFTFRAYLEGYRLAVCRDLLIYHESPGGYNDTWAHFARRFMRKFKDRLPPRPVPETSPTVRVVVDRAALDDARLAAALADPANLQGLVNRGPSR